MDRKMFLSVLLMAVLGFLVLMLLPTQNREPGPPRLPWLVEQDPAGRTRVFGFTLGETPLSEVREAFGEEGKINLFARLGVGANATDLRVEAYFEQIYLMGLRADFVIPLRVDEATLEPMYQRGLRISQLGSGAKKIDLAPEDAQALLQAPIDSITYLPWKSLDAEILRNRFGDPAETKQEPETGVLHWLYPDKGMDIAMEPDGGTVIQYVNRAEFGRIRSPLDAMEH